jgi:uncharacterized protein YdeI (YjbR/CyaY-like superfamily)
MKPRHFRTQADFREWLEKHHASKTEEWIGFYKATSKKKGITYQEAIDEALCFGWIDGIVKSVDADSYMHRFTPRKATSHWSNINVRRYAELKAAGLIRPAGEAAYARRTDERTGKASYERVVPDLTAAQLKQIKANRKAWEFFQKQPPGYQKVCRHYVTSAKQEATRERRLQNLIACSAEGRRLDQFISPPGKK